MIKRASYFLLAICFCIAAEAQTISDSANRNINVDSAIAKKDTTKHSISPRRAAIRSAIIPGWGQVSVRKDLDASFFRKYYSIPIIYGAIGTSAGVFAYNLTWYRRTRYAYKVLVNKDSSNLTKVHRKLQYYITTNNASSLQQYRNGFRRDLDYSALFVVLMWGLNVVHASVEAHLKDFDVSPDLGLRFKAGHSELAGTDGVSLILTFK